MNTGHVLYIYIFKQLNVPYPHLLHDLIDFLFIYILTFCPILSVSENLY